MSLKIKSKGFTLIELMIVVAIIGILAAVAIPKFADLVTKSKEAAVKGNLGAVRSALAIYYGDNEGVYPVADGVFTALTTEQKYMPNVGGVASLGDFSIPAHGTVAGHPNRKATTAGSVLDNATADDATALVYTDATTGELFVNCTHTDTKGSQWTAH
jgi:prepilin-type N-terminal cleavage/methylation domain-containing protein